MTEKERSRAKFRARIMARQAELNIRSSVSRKHMSTNEQREASREEQHATFIDVGPQAWDDIGFSPDR